MDCHKIWNNFVDPLTFHLWPLSGYEILAKLMTFQSTSAALCVCQTENVSTLIFQIWYTLLNVMSHQCVVIFEHTCGC